MASNDPSTPSVKQQREAKRAEKVAVLKAQQAKEKRNRRIGIIAAAVGAAAVLALVIVFVVTSSVPKPDAADIRVKGVQTFKGLTNVHVDPKPVDYEKDYGMNPPAGGNHFGAWLNCGVYSEPQQNENAVHALEHGAVWITYDPEALDEADVQTLRDAMPRTYSILSPYPDLPAPVVASGWGVQLQLDGADDPRLADFITKYRLADSVPERGAPCTGALDGPGRVS
jgi:hypothetical protein